MWDLPESGVSRWPFELVLFEQMNSEVVAPAETLIAHMALVASDKIPLIMEKTDRTTKDIKMSNNNHFKKSPPLFIPHAFSFGETSWWSGCERWSCSRECSSGTPARCCEFPSVCASPTCAYTWQHTKSNVWVLIQMGCNSRVLKLWGMWKPVFAVITTVRLLVAVAELDMASPRRGCWTCHVAQRAFVVAHCTIKKKTLVNIVTECSKAFFANCNRFKSMGITASNTDGMTAAGLTVCSHVVSQQSLRRKAFRAMRTLEHLTYSTHKHKAKIRKL